MINQGNGKFILCAFIVGAVIMSLLIATVLFIVPRLKEKSRMSAHKFIRKSNLLISIILYALMACIVSPIVYMIEKYFNIGFSFIFAIAVYLACKPTVEDIEKLMLK